MSFCIRSITSNSRYVPTIVTSAQGCTVRRFNCRQLPKHVQPATTSTFLTEFLGSKVPLSLSADTKEDYNKLSNVSKDLSYHTHPQNSSARVYCLLDDYRIDNIKEDIIGQLPNDENYELLPHEITRLSHMNLMRDQLIHFDSLKSFENDNLQGENWIYTNHQANIISTDTNTKDETKNFLLSVSRNVKEKVIDPSSDKKSSDERKPSLEELEHIYKTLSADLPNFFSKSQDYRIYHPDLEFINNIRGTRTKGVFNYMKALSFIRLAGHLKYAYIKLEILKITKHPQDNTIRVRWRVNGITGMKVIFNFWKFKFWKIREALKEQEVWLDGFSIFYVGEDGRVFRHVIEKMMPDENAEVKPKPIIPTKLAQQLTFSSLD